VANFASFVRPCTDIRVNTGCAKSGRLRQVYLKVGRPDEEEASAAGRNATGEAISERLSSGKVPIPICANY